MKSATNFNLSFGERSMKARAILARQPATSFVQALAQIEWLQKTLKISQSDLMVGDSSKPSIKLTACTNVIVRNNLFNTSWKAIVNIESKNPKQVNTNYSIIQMDAKKGKQ